MTPGHIGQRREAGQASAGEAEKLEVGHVRAVGVAHLA
jgi:hypothetical protein